MSIIQACSVQVRKETLICISQKEGEEGTNIFYPPRHREGERRGQNQLLGPFLPCLFHGLSVYLSLLSLPPPPRIKRRGEIWKPFAELMGSPIPKVLESTLRDLTDFASFERPFKIFLDFLDLLALSGHQPRDWTVPESAHLACRILAKKHFLSLSPRARSQFKPFPSSQSVVHTHMQFPHKLPKEKGRRKKRDERTPILLSPVHNTTIFRGRRLKPSFAISTHSRRVPTSHEKKGRKREYYYYSAIVAQKRMETSISAQQSSGSRNHKKTNNAAMLRLASASQFCRNPTPPPEFPGFNAHLLYFFLFFFCLPGMSNVRVCACLHSPFPHSAAGGILTRRRSHGFCLLEELDLRRQFFRR